MRATLLSNGHGEDAVGVQLARAFRAHAPGLELQAFPTVGQGQAYEALELPILGPRREMPSGGFMMHTASAFWADMRAGFLPMTAAQLRALRRLETDLLVVIGDVYALLLGTLVQTSARFYVQTLVSAHQKTRSRPNRYFMERISAPERFLMRRTVRHSYLRDVPTAESLQRYGLGVSAPGNPMLDALGYEGLPLTLPPHRPVVALLPGTRSHRDEALVTMLRTLSSWPEALGLIAWTGAALPVVPGWRWLESGPDLWTGVETDIRKDTGAGREPVPSGHAASRIYLFKNRFAAVLHAAQLVLGTAGTAHEQAAALGLPIVTFPLPPIYSRPFIQNQKRLLGEAVSVSERDPAALLQTLRRLYEDPSLYERAARVGRARMGQAGGSAAIVRDILGRIDQPELLRFH